MSKTVLLSDEEARLIKAYRIAGRPARRIIALALSDYGFTPEPQAAKVISFQEIQEGQK